MTCSFGRIKSDIFDALLHEADWIEAYLSATGSIKTGLYSPGRFEIR